MKRWKSIPALLALIALLLPCEHLAGHDHQDCTTGTEGIATQVIHHACTETVCSDKIDLLLVQSLPLVDLPIPDRQFICRAPIDDPARETVCLPPAALRSIKTIQLLI